jgi:hypothetical protein
VRQQFQMIKLSRLLVRVVIGVVGKLGFAPLVTTDIPIDPVDVAAVFLEASVDCADHVLDGVVVSSIAGSAPGLVALVTVQFSLVVEWEVVVAWEVVVEPENVRDGVGLG